MYCKSFITVISPYFIYVSLKIPAAYQTGNDKLIKSRHRAFVESGLIGKLVDKLLGKHHICASCIAPDGPGEGVDVDNPSLFIQGKYGLLGLTAWSKLRLKIVLNNISLFFSAPFKVFSLFGGRCRNSAGEAPLGGYMKDLHLAVP